MLVSVFGKTSTLHYHTHFLAMFYFEGRGGGGKIGTGIVFY